MLALAMGVGLLAVLTATPSAAVTTGGTGTVVSGGAGYGCAVRADGKLACWGKIGSVDSPIPVIYPGLSGVRQFAAASNTGCALLSSRSVQCFGVGTGGQLGNNTLTSSDTPVTVLLLPDAVSIAAGANHFCAVRAGNGVRCWGQNGSGQLGTGTTTTQRQPVNISGSDSGIVAGAVQISAGANHTCVRRNNGAAACWGANDHGQLGDGTTTGSTKPVAVSGLAGASALSSGGATTCAIVAGAPTCWGSGAQGALGNGGTADATTPVAVSGSLSGLTSVGTSANGTCVIGDDGTVACWGAYVGDGTATASTTPKAVDGLTDAAHLSSGQASPAPCAVLTGGALRCWGSGTTGALGDGSGADQLSPVAIPGGSAYYGGSSAPTAPSAPTIKPATAYPGAAKVSWSAPADDGGSPVTGYVVTPYLGSTPQTPTTFAEPYVEQSVTALTPGQTYTFTVRAINAIGTGPESAHSNEVVPTPVYTPPAAPTDVVAAAAADGSATVTWTAPVDTGGLALGDYTVLAYSPTAPSSTQTLPPSATSATFTGLHNTSRYTFSVRASNARGTSGSAISNSVYACRCIGGELLDQTDAPLADVRVRAIDATTGKLGGEATTDATGSYVLPVPSATAGYKIQFADKANLVERFPLQYRMAGSTVAVEVATTGALSDRIVVQRSILGRLLDQGGAPLPGMRVRAIDATSGKLGAEATTDATGAYELRVPSPTAGYKVQFADKVNTTPLFPLQYRTVSGSVAVVSGGPTVLEDRITVTRAITGVVIDGTTGDPVAGLRLRALKPTLVDETTSAADGTFTFDGLAAGTAYTVQVADKRAVPVYPIRWYANSVNQAGATPVAAGDHITFVVWPS